MTARCAEMASRQPVWAQPRTPAQHDRRAHHRDGEVGPTCQQAILRSDSTEPPRKQHGQPRQHQRFGNPAGAAEVPRGVHAVYGQAPGIRATHAGRMDVPSGLATRRRGRAGRGSTHAHAAAAREALRTSPPSTTRRTSTQTSPALPALGSWRPTSPRNFRAGARPQI